MMDLKNKLKGLPHIYYFNLDNRIDRREYMESQFDHWGIKNYTRVSSSKYLASKFDKWKHHLSNDNNCQTNPIMNANFLTQIETIKNWLETTNDDHFILFEDDYDLSLIEYWNFDWEYLMNNIPYDWDCIQLGYESFTHIQFFLHPRIPGTYFGPCLINRYYAEKLIRLYYKNNKVIIDNEKNDVKNIINRMSVGNLDHSILTNGKVYCIPLIPQNPNITSFENSVERGQLEWNHVYKSYELYYNWWKHEHHKFPIEDFFTYGKPNDFKMTRSIVLNTFNLNKKYY